MTLYAPAARDAGMVFQLSVMEPASEAWNLLLAPVSTAYPLANLGLFVPFSVPIPCIVVEGFVFSGTLTTGSFDIGVYDAAGTRLTSSGATAKATASAPVNTTTMTNLTLTPNKRYYMAFSANSTDAYYANTLAAGLYASMGICEATTAYVLPSSVTYVITTRAYLPQFGLNLQTVGF